VAGSQLLPPGHTVPGFGAVLAAMALLAIGALTSPIRKDLADGSLHSSRLLAVFPMLMPG